MRPKVAIESPYKGDVQKNIEFCRKICRYAISQNKNPYAMHLFFTQFLDDSKPEERNLGIACGLDWTDLADEIWFCLRPGEMPSAGMQAAIDRHNILLKEGKQREVRYLYFSQQGELLGEWDFNTLVEV